MAMILEGSCSSLISTAGGAAAAAGNHHGAASSSVVVAISSSSSSSAWRRGAGLKSSYRARLRRRSSVACVVCETKEASPAGKVDDVNFKTLVMESEIPVLVDFWAPWCGPCRMLDPVIDSIAEKYKGKIKCYKVNTDECSKTATELGIRSIPTCMIFKQGERLDTVIGCVPETTLTAVIDKYISS